MLWIFLIISVIGIFLTSFSAIIDIANVHCPWSDIGKHAMRIGFFIILGLIGFFGLNGIDALSYEEVSEPTREFKLVSLTDNSELSESDSWENGSWLSSSTGTEDIYSFYYEVNIGQYKRGKVNAAYTTIYEKDDCAPLIIEYTPYPQNKMNTFLRKILTFGYGEAESLHKTYEIYIPTGTILRTFSLDAQ